VATSNMLKNLVSLALWLSSYASRQTDILITILRTPPNGKIMLSFTVIHRLLGFDNDNVI